MLKKSESDSLWNRVRVWRRACCRECSNSVVLDPIMSTVTSLGKMCRLSTVLRRAFWNSGVGLAGLWLLSGCQRTPQLGSDSRELLQRLQTAVSAKNPEWLNACEDQILATHNRSGIPDQEFKALVAVVDRARSGDWKQAQMDSFKLSEGQKSTFEDRERLKERPRRKRTERK